MRLALFAAAVLILMLFAGNGVRACDCVTLSPDKSFENADFVFEGQLLGIEPVQSNELYGFVYVFKINQTLKGPNLRTVALAGDNTNCDAQFKPNVVYRVYARSNNGTLVSGSCSGNQVVGFFRVYRGFTTIDHAALWQRPFMKVLAVCGLGVLLGSGVFVWRRCIRKLP